MSTIQKLHAALAQQLTSVGAGEATLEKNSSTHNEHVFQNQIKALAEAYETLLGAVAAEHKVGEPIAADIRETLEKVRAFLDAHGVVPKAPARARHASDHPFVAGLDHRSANHAVHRLVDASISQGLGAMEAKGMRAALTLPSIFNALESLRDSDPALHKEALAAFDGMASGLDLLDAQASTPDEINRVCIEISDHVARMGDAAQLFREKLPSVATMLVHASDQLSQKAESLQRRFADSPCTEAALYAYRGVYASSAARVLNVSLDVVEMREPNDALAATVLALELRAKQLSSIGQNIPRTNKEILGKKAGDWLHPLKKWSHNKALEKAKEALKTDFPSVLADVTNKALLGITEIELMGLVVDMAHKHAGLEPLADAEQAIEATSQRIRSFEIPWKTVRNTIRLSVGGHVASFQSNQVPATLLDGDTGVFARSYRNTGRTAYATTETDHAANMWRSEFSTADGKEAFAGIRHGIHVPFGINAKHVMAQTQETLQRIAEATRAHENASTDVMHAMAENPGIVARSRLVDLAPGIESADDLAIEASDQTQQLLREAMEEEFSLPDPSTMSGISSEHYAALAKHDPKVAKELALHWRQMGSRNRVIESFKAALVSNPALMQRAKSGETVNLPITSISLVSGDWVRDGGDASNSNERLMNAEQTAMFQALSGVPLVMDLGDGTSVRIKPMVTTFNFGVNAGAVALGGYDPLGIWAHAEQQNAEAMQRFQISVKACLARDDLAQDTRNKIETLNAQILDIWKTGAYKAQGEDPYKITSRIALLAYLMGETPMWNCKSGKDRTGQEDVEIKFLIAHHAVFGFYPDPNTALSSRQSDMLLNIAVASGNREVQAHSTWTSGFKLKGVSSLMRRLFGSNKAAQKAGKPEYFGNSDYVGS